MHCDIEKNVVSLELQKKNPTAWISATYSKIKNLLCNPVYSIINLYLIVVI